MSAQLLRPEEAAEQLCISRTRVFALMREGHLESVPIGRSRRIPADAITKLIDGLRSGAAPVSPS